MIINQSFFCVHIHLDSHSKKKISKKTHSRNDGSVSLKCYKEGKLWWLKGKFAENGK